MKKEITGWAIVMKDDGFLPDLDMEHLRGILHIHTRKKDALKTIDGINDKGWTAAQCTITYEVCECFEAHGDAEVNDDTCGCCAKDHFVDADKKV